MQVVVKPGSIDWPGHNIPTGPTVDARVVVNVAEHDRRGGSGIPTAAAIARGGTGGAVRRCYEPRCVLVHCIRDVRAPATGRKRYASVQMLQRLVTFLQPTARKYPKSHVSQNQRERTLPGHVRFVRTAEATARTVQCRRAFYVGNVLSV